MNIYGEGPSFCSDRHRFLTHIGRSSSGLQLQLIKYGIHDGSPPPFTRVEERDQHSG